MSSRIPLARPILGDSEIRAAERVLRSGQLTGGAEVVELESELAARAQRRYAVAMSSATSALELALWALGVGPGHEVLVPAFGFPAAAGTSHRVGATPIPVDCSLETWNMDVAAARALITPRTRAMISIDQFGLPAESAELVQLAKDTGVPLVSDAACSIGGHDSAGRPAGSYGELAVFSFHPRKVITCGEGGSVVTDDENLCRVLMTLRNQGQSTPGSFVRPGTNARLSAIHAAILRPQLARLDEICKQRQQLARAYTEQLALLCRLGKIQLQSIPPGARSVFQTFALRLATDIDRSAVLSALKTDGIECGPATYACSRVPALTATGAGNTPNASLLHDRAMALPLFPTMEISDIKSVVDSLSRVLA